MQINLVFARRVEHQAPMQRFEHSFEYFQSLSRSGDLGNLVVIFLHDDRSDWPHETRLPHEIHGIRIFIIQPKVYFFFHSRRLALFRILGVINFERFSKRGWETGLLLIDTKVAVPSSFYRAKFTFFEHLIFQDNQTVSCLRKLMK